MCRVEPTMMLAMKLGEVDKCVPDILFDQVPTFLEESAYEAIRPWCFFRRNLLNYSEQLLFCEILFKP